MGIILKVERCNMFAECITLHNSGYREELTLLLRHVLRMQFMYYIWTSLHMSPAYYIETEISANSVTINQLQFHEHMLLHLLHPVQQWLSSLWGNYSLCLINGTVKSHNSTICPMNSSVCHHISIILGRNRACLLIWVVAVTFCWYISTCSELWLC